ncbi:MAG: hypothetical protein LBR47_00105, partial [Spirochaetaceae bacterium]|nr:hypothetical protein [Spirochaetaceae bacterium]
DGNAAFQTIDGFCETFPVQFHVLLVFSQISIDGCGTYLGEFFRNFLGNTEGWPLSNENHLLPEKRSEDFPAFEPEKSLQQAEHIDDLIIVDTLSFSV